MYRKVNQNQASVRQAGLEGRLGISLGLVANDVVAQLDAFIADEYRGPGDELSDLMLALAAKGAVEQLFARTLFLRHGHSATEPALPERPDLKK
jgi:hypothetical protein